MSLASLSLVVDVDFKSEVMSSTIWVSVFPGTIGGLLHLSLASLSSVVGGFLASSFCLIHTFLLFPLFFCYGLFIFLFLFTSMEVQKEKAELFIFCHFLMERFLLLTMLLLDHPHCTLLLPFTTFWPAYQAPFPSPFDSTMCYGGD